MNSPAKRHDYLRRLAPEVYRGRAIVHWSLTVANRRTGWLNELSHSIWRETLLHTCGRYEVAAPVYCLMPDHVHVLLVGFGKDSDQRLAMSFLKKYSATMFRSWNGVAWQKQSYDHVLRKQERMREAFISAVHYISENPGRAGLAINAKDWLFSGSMVAGWPDLDWRREDFWERWWLIFTGGEKESGSESASATA